MSETTPAADVPETSVEDRLAAAFEKAGVRDDPDETGDDEPKTGGDEVSAEGGESGDDDGETPSETVDDAEEVEYEGKAYKLPKELKEALLRQQDYTRKTQEVADKRRTLDEQAKAVQLQAQFHSANFAKAVEAQALQTRLQQFAQVDWAGLAESNPGQYLMLDRQYRELQEANHRVNAEMQNLGEAFRAQTVEAKQKAQALCIEELKRDFKDFGPELLKQLDDTGKHFGFSGEELAQVTDPRLIRVLHAATQYRKLKDAKPLIEKRVQDAAPIKAKMAASTQTNRQNVQLKDLQTRLQKTGRSSDAEAFLAARIAKSMR